MKYVFALLLTLSSSAFFAQDIVVLSGKVQGEGVELESIIIVNETSDESTKTDQDGNFQISAAAGDILIVASTFINGVRKPITSANIESKSITIAVSANINMLDEVEINSLNAQSLGILSKPAKTFTPAERQLETAGDFKPIHLLSILGGSMPLDPVINKISGRTKRLKQLVEMERREVLRNKIIDLIASQNKNNRLNIPPDLEKGFAYYLLENREFVTTFNTDENMTEFLLIKLAPEYLKSTR